MPTTATPPLYRYVGRIIHVMRKERGMRQSELAALTGLKQPNLSRIENGIVVPRQSTLRKVAEALDVEVKELLSESKAREVEAKWSAIMSPKNAGQLYSGKLHPVTLYTATDGAGIIMDGAGVPIGDGELTLQLAPIPGRAFAIRAFDDAMQVPGSSPTGDSFRMGEVLVFSDLPDVRSTDYALVQLRRKVYFRTSC